jgi:membrane-bound metal-dependent hydrolase YbcI (DUF457 family)
MDRFGHHWTGISSGVLTGSILLSAGCPLSYAVVPILSSWIGGTAPDWLEISRAKLSSDGVHYERRSVIPHRTITHWWPLWVFPLIYISWSIFGTIKTIGNVHYNLSIAVTLLALGFFVGGITHLLMDVPNPMGIPLKCPLGKCRYSLRWWKSGNSFEPIFSILWFFFSVLIFYFAYTN